MSSVTVYCFSFLKTLLKFESGFAHKELFNSVSTECLCVH